MNVKNFFLMFFSQFLMTGLLYSQDVIITNQMEMDSFDSETTIIDGDLYIACVVNESFPITDLSHFSNLERILGSLTIENCDSLRNLEGLNKLKTIGEFVNISYNGLSSLEGLELLRYVGNGQSEIKILNNSKLEDLDGLIGLFASGSLKIISNEALKNVDGLLNYGVNNWGIIIRDNQSLQNLNGLSGISNLDNLIIDNNDGLKSLEGLGNVESIVNLNIVDNDSLETLIGLEGLLEIDSSFNIINNEQLSHIDALEMLNGSLVSLKIESNQQLKNIDGLKNIESIRSRLSITENQTLSNIDGLIGLESGGFWDGISIKISENDSLLNLDGLKNISIFSMQFIYADSWINVFNNSSLSDCCGIKHVFSPWVFATVSGNPSNCSSIQEIKDSCISSSSFQVQDTNIHLYPNPTDDMVYVYSSEQISDMYLFDISGRAIELPTNKIFNQIDLSSLATGLYILKLRTNTGFEMMERIVKE